MSDIVRPVTKACPSAIVSFTAQVTLIYQITSKNCLAEIKIIKVKN